MEVMGDFYMRVTLTKHSRLETIVDHLYKKLNIQHVNDIDLELICDLTEVTLHYAPIRSQAFTDSRIIIVDNRLSKYEQREELSHELAHVMIHSGSQLFSPKEYVQLQEIQAERLAMYLLVPTFILEKEFINISFEQGYTQYLSEIFRVTEPFMLNRLKHYFIELESKENVEKCNCSRNFFCADCSECIFVNFCVNV